MAPRDPLWEASDVVGEKLERAAGGRRTAQRTTSASATRSDCATATAAATLTCWWWASTADDEHQCGQTETRMCVHEVARYRRELIRIEFRTGHTSDHLRSVRRDRLAVGSLDRR